MSKCPYCGKSVYFAERQLYNGKEYHQTCVWTLTKEEEKRRGQPLFSISEARFANPHEAHTTGGQDAALNAPKASGSSVKVAAVAQSGVPATAPSGKAKFCPSCGTPAGAGNFCASCGAKLVA